MRSPRAATSLPQQHTLQEEREREREMAKEIQEGDLDEDDLGGEFEGM